jgi:hypothetical protein
VTTFAWAGDRKNMKPVTLVKTVASQNTAVVLGRRCEPIRPNTTGKPLPMAANVMRT